MPEFHLKYCKTRGIARIHNMKVFPVIPFRSYYKNIYKILVLPIPVAELS